MRSQFWISVVVVGSTLFCTPVATGQDWDPITEMEKSLNTNPIDPGGGAIVLFKRGNIKLGTEKVFAATRVTTYTRIKILNEAGRKFANISIESSKYDRLSKIEGRTVLPSGEIIRLDPSQIFKGKEYEFGSGLSIFKTSFALPSAEPGAIVEYRTVQNSSWYSVPPWVFDTQGLATLRSTLTILIGRVLYSPVSLGNDSDKNQGTRKQNSKRLGIPLRSGEYSPSSRRALRCPISRSGSGSHFQACAIHRYWGGSSYGVGRCSRPV